VSEETYQVEKVISNKFEKGQYFFYIKWKGYSDAFNSWEPEGHLEPDLLESLMEDIKKEKVLSNSLPSKRPKISQGNPNKSHNNNSHSPTDSSSHRKLPHCHDQLGSPSKGNTINPTNLRSSSKYLSSNASSCSSSGVSSLSPASSSSSSTSCQSPNNSSNKTSNQSNDQLRENERLLASLIPGKIVSIESNIQGRKAALVKFVNQEPLAWVEYDYAKEKMPELLLDYYENILVFA
jgi:hypothetical protein